MSTYPPPSIRNNLTKVIEARMTQLIFLLRGSKCVLKFVCIIILLCIKDLPPVYPHMIYNLAWHIFEIKKKMKSCSIFPFVTCFSKSHIAFGEVTVTDTGTQFIHRQWSLITQFICLFFLSVDVQVFSIFFVTQLECLLAHMCKLFL